MGTRITAAVALAIGATAATPALAETVLLEQVSFIGAGLAPTTRPLQVTQPGYLFVQVSDTAFPAALRDAGALLTTSTSVLGTVRPGTPQQFAVTPGTLFATVIGTPQGALNLGAAGVKITFSTAPIPLPAAAWLLLGGLGLVAAAGRRTRTREASAV